jgi:glycosyltransferase involved in cell wall biosynthesis
MFYPNLDVLTVPSLNSTEAFGLVQIEAMMNGVPCVTSSLPGVRQPVGMHQMGAIFPIGDAEQLAAKMIDVLKQKKTLRSAERDFSQYRPDCIAQAYEELFAEIQRSI